MPRPEANRLIENVTRLVYAIALALAIGTMFAPKGKPPEHHIEDTIVDPMLMKRLRELPRLLASSAEMEQKAPRLAAALSSKGTAQEKCFVIRDVLAKHKDDVLTIATFLNGNAGGLSNEQLRLGFQTYVRDKLNMTPEYASEHIDEVWQALSKRMEGSYSYGVIQRCHAVEMFFFGGFLSKSIKDHEKKAIPIIGEVIKGVRDGAPGAAAAAHALGRIEASLIKGP